MCFPWCIPLVPRATCRFPASNHSHVAGIGQSGPFLLSIMLGLGFCSLCSLFLWPSLRIWLLGGAFLGMGKAHNTHGAKGQKEEICDVSCDTCPFRTPPFFLCYSWGRVGGINSDSPHTARASDSAQLWCSSNPARSTVGALPQLPRSSQTRSDVFGSALNDTKFISKLDTHTSIKNSPATNGA